MNEREILVLKGNEVLSILADREIELIRIVRLAYESHAEGHSSLPHSTFLYLPYDQGNRIIALPAYLGGDFGVAGIKWIASFPRNRDIGLDRASAVVILNSIHTGRPKAVVEGSVISAKRTAASAALAAQLLRNDRKIDCAGIIGCGLINFEITRFLLTVFPEIKTLAVFDKHRSRARQFVNKCSSLGDGIEVTIAGNMCTVFRSSSLVSIATTATNPHIHDLSDCAPGGTILHISLRDLAPEVILSCDNIVDDIDHVCRSQTSIHLAEQIVGNRDFIRCTLADILRGTAVARKDADSIAVFSPFGLGILDIAVCKFVYDLGLRQGKGATIESFLPDPWVQRY